MRTIPGTTGTTGKTRRAPVTTALAAVCLAVPMSGLFGGTAFATNDHGGSAAPGQAKKSDASTAATPAPAPAPAPSPYTNQGGVTTGSNTTKYETVSDHKGSTYTGVGGGQTNGDIHSPQPYSKADKSNTGANDTSAGNQYRSTRDGSPALNGNGGGKQVGQPCAGCVGKADNKNPPGQHPNGTDHNAGYECDRNHGIGRSNPAHTGCTGGGSTGGGSTGGGSTGGGNSTGGNSTGGSTGGDHGNKNDKISICHATGSSSNPFVVITPNKSGVVHGHAQHADDIISPFTYNDHGLTRSFPGLNWTTAGQALLANGCHVPAPPKPCPNGSPMPASGNVADCTLPVVCPAGTTMSNGTCAPPIVCPEGTAMVGPIVQGSTRPGCTVPVTVPVSGGTGGEAQDPPLATTPTPTVIGSGSNPQPVARPVGAPAGGPTVTAAAPAGLPFTGADAALLAQLALLMILVGGGLAVVTRKPKAARAVV